MADARMTQDEARKKARECRELAEKARDPEHRKMLEEMAEAWEQIAAERYVF
jgi:hypothetical protein